MERCDPGTCSLDSILLANKAVGEKYLIDGGNANATWVKTGKLKAMIKYENEAKSKLKTRVFEFFPDHEWFIDCCTKHN